MGIKELRAQTGLSQSKFANLFDIPVATLKDWEQGRRKPPIYGVNMIKTILEYRGMIIGEDYIVACENRRKCKGRIRRMKKILWLSRHQMTEEQINELMKIYGDIIVLQDSKQINNVEELLQDIESMDVLAVVLPIEMVGELLKITDKPIIYAENKRVFDENGKVAFSFGGWRQYVRVDIETKAL